ncbi:MAG: hypothetical protein NC339_03125 [Muribaculaceae bacterium]|nr:hypothetical protein [Muribaculaceae bacterium]
MRHSLRFTALLAATVVSSACAFARTPIRQEARDSMMRDERVILLGDRDRGEPSMESQRRLIEQFYINQFENTRQPDAPYFLFMSRDANLAMGIGGNVKLRTYFDPGNSLPGSSFAPYDIPMTRDELNRNHWAWTPDGTALYFRVIGHSSKVGTYQVYIKAKFNGGTSNNFKLNKAYATLNDWTVGYATSTFSDGAAEPPTVDATGTTLSMDYTTMLVRYLHSFGKTGFSVAASIEDPSMSFETVYLSDGSASAKPRVQSVPDILAMAQYQWAPGQHVRISGIVRWLPYRNLVNNTNHSLHGWGFQLSTVLNPLRPLTLYGTLNFGRSYTNNTGNFLLSAYDLVGVSGHDGRMSTIPSWSYLIGATYHFSHKLFTTVSFGQARVTDSKLSDPYKYGLYGAANIFYNLTPRIQFGGEVSVGKRQEFSGAHAYARRLSAMAQFTF